MANEFKVKNGLVVSGATTITGSVIATTGFTGSFSGSLTGTASWATNVVNGGTINTGSFATTGSNTFKGAQTFQNNVTIQGTASITYLNVTYESASVIYSTGSNQFGDAVDDIQLLIGTTKMSGSAEITGSLRFLNGGVTGSLFGTAATASYVLQAVSSSFSTTASYSTSSSVAVSSSFATSASYAASSSVTVSASFATTASYARSSSVAVSSSYALSSSVAVSSSFATTASYIILAQTASYVKNAQTASFVSTLNQNVTLGNGYYLQVGGYSKTFSNQELNVSTSPTAVVSVDFSTYPHKSIFMRYVLSNSTPSPTDLRAGTIMVVSDGVSNINLTEVTTQDIGDTSAVDFSATITGGNTNVIRINITGGGTWDVQFDYTII
jgi:hypothetical protein